MRKKGLSVKYKEYKNLKGKNTQLVQQVGDGSIIKRFDRTPQPSQPQDVVCPHFLELKWAKMGFYFPSGFKLRAGKSVTIYTGSGINTTSKLYWGRKEGENMGEGAIWTNDGDCAYLVNEQGNVVHKYCW